jgi:N-methylhydantoinase A/oxoprolinase/acetone carboxylase beta subunit
MGWQIRVDVGGTFPDFLALEPAAGLFSVAKVPLEDQIDWGSLPV